MRTVHLIFEIIGVITVVGGLGALAYWRYLVACVEGQG